MYNIMIYIYIVLFKIMTVSCPARQLNSSMAMFVYIIKLPLLVVVCIHSIYLALSLHSPQY